MRLYGFGLAAALALSAAQAVDSQGLPPQLQMSYADLADLALIAPVVAQIEVDDTDLLNEEEAPDVPAGHRRFLIEAHVVALIRGAGGVPAQVSYLVDLPNDARGRRARVPEHSQYLVLATKVPQHPGELRLIAPDAQIPYTPRAAEQLRDILSEAVAPDAPPRITGIGRAFHVPGSLPGESETQIFLQTEDDRPISLTILRRPGQQPRWAVALSEIVDAAAAPPEPRSLLWYRLACTLPSALPEEALRELNAEEAAAVQADYDVVIEGLGPCTRNRRTD